MLLQAGDRVVVHRDEDLVGGRLHRQRVAAFAQHRADACGRLVGVTGDVHVPVVLEQRVELQAEQPALGQQRAVLFDGGQEVLRRVVLREHDGLTEQGADLGAADVEHIGQPGDVLERDIGAIGGQRVPQARAIEEQLHAVAVADAAQGLQLVQRVQRAVFRGMGDVDGAGEHHMLVVAVRVERGAVVVELGGVDLAVMVGERQHLVPGGLDGAGLMHVDVPGGGGHRACIGGGDGVDDGLVGLGAADQEAHIRIRRAAGLADAGLGGFADGVGAVAGELRGVRGFQTFEDAGVGAAAVVVLKGQHGRFLPHGEGAIL